MKVFRQARIRLTVWYVALVAALLVIFCGLSYGALHLWLWRSVDASLRRECEWMAALLRDAAEGGDLDWDEVRTELEEHRVAQATAMAIQVRDAMGRVLFVHDVPSGQLPLLSAAEDVPYTIHDRPLRGYRALTSRTDSYLVTIAASTARERSLLSSVRLAFAVAIPALLALAGLVGWTFTARALQPADDAYRHMQRFMADAAHELRAPVTAIRGECDVALRRPRERDQYRETLVHVERQSDVMGRLLANLALLTRVDAHQEALQLQSLGLGELVAEQVELLRPSAQLRDIAIHADLDADVTVLGDDLRLQQLLVNLLDNAIKFSDQGGEVQVALKQQHGSAVLEVADAGLGIPAEHIPHIFERFYRVDKSRSRERGGSGLGLSICKWIAEAHGGRIEVSSRPGEGSRFTVFLPLAREH